jgi:hypothetical protein
LCQAKELWALGGPSTVNDASRRSRDFKDELGGKPEWVGVYASERLSFRHLGKASRGKPRRKPESGKPTFRDCREARGNVTFVLYGTVRASRIYPDHVRICGRLGAKFPGPTRQWMSVPNKNTKSSEPKLLQHQRWFRRGQKWRTGSEGRISVLKRRHGLRRCHYPGLDGMRRWVGLGVIADNFIQMGYYLARQST